MTDTKKPYIPTLTFASAKRDAKLVMRLGALNDFTYSRELGSTRWIKTINDKFPEHDADLDGEYWSTCRKLKEMFRETPQRS